METLSQGKDLFLSPGVWILQRVEIHLESAARQGRTPMHLDCRLYIFLHLVALWGQYGGTTTKLKTGGVQNHRI